MQKSIKQRTAVGIQSIEGTNQNKRNRCVNLNIVLRRASSYRAQMDSNVCSRFIDNNATTLAD